MAKNQCAWCGTIYRTRKDLADHLMASNGGWNGCGFELRQKLARLQAEKRRPCMFCGCTEEPVTEHNDWPHCPKCKGV